MGVKPHPPGSSWILLSGPRELRLAGFFFVSSVQSAWATFPGGGPIDENDRWRVGPYVKSWDFPSPDHWSEPPKSGGRIGVNVGPRVEPTSLTESEVTVLRALVGHDPYWFTECDLPAVYGLPTSREELASFGQSS